MGRALLAMAIKGASGYAVILFMVTAVWRFLGVIAMVSSPMAVGVVVEVMAGMGIGGIIALATVPPGRPAGSALGLEGACCGCPQPRAWRREARPNSRNRPPLRR